MTPRGIASMRRWSVMGLATVCMVRMRARNTVVKVRGSVSCGG